uniref:Peptidase family M54 n=1 Tax=uncultured marine microorganism HF4000_APKG10H11 TaxID=455559 RepID=B3TC41_9ZZZZ|nr:hypothetical protein ALOHA_HF4000APKG10H11ctg1g10 [uncultured marine microorganism HF4000_APKG10H11]
MNMTSVAIILYEMSESDLSQINDVIFASINYFFDNVKIKIINSTLPSSVINTHRGQINAEEIIQSLSKNSELNDSDLNIGLTKQDIYYKNMNHIFGLAQTNGKNLALSTFRLERDLHLNIVSPNLYQERVFKELLHELGHISGLSHCELNTCVMSFSSNVAQVDIKLPMFCKNCNDVISYNNTGR